MSKGNKLPPVHPGQILRETVLPALGLSVTAAAKTLGISRQMLHGILSEKNPLSAEMSLKMARLAGGDAETWMRVQAMYDLKKATRNRALMSRVKKISPMRAQSAHI